METLEEVKVDPVVDAAVSHAGGEAELAGVATDGEDLEGADVAGLEVLRVTELEVLGREHGHFTHLGVGGRCGVLAEEGSADVEKISLVQAHRPGGEERARRRQ